VKRVRASLAAWSRTAFVESVPPVRVPEQRAVHVMDRPGSVQTTLVLGGPATSRADTDYLPMLIANTVLGGSPAARLFRRLREERGTSYNAQSQLATYRHGGFWLVYGDTGITQTGDALGGFLDELRRLSAEPVPAAELDDAKRSLLGRLALTLEMQSQLASYMANRRMEGLSADYWERYPDMLQAVTADDVRRAAGKHMDLSKVLIVAVGDREQLVPLLQPFGSITFYDSEGKPPLR
jgi:predicted Zn-dependent peptidase